MKKQKKVDFKKNAINFLKISSKYKSFYFFAIIAIAIVSLMELVEKYIFKELIDQGTNYFNGVITQNVFTEIIIVLTIIFTISWIIRTVGNWFRFHLINTLDGKIIFDLKKWFFEHIIELSHNFHTTHRTGSLIARFTRGGRAIEAINDFLLFDLIPFALRFVVAFVPIFYVDNISGLILILIIIAYLTYSFFILKKRNKVNINLNNVEDIEKAHLSDSFSNIETVKYFGKENFILNKYNQHTAKTKEQQIKLWNYGRWMVSGHTIIRSLGLTILLISPTIRLINGEMTIGTYAFIYTLFLGLMSPLEHFAWSLRRMFEGIIDFSTLTRYLDIKKEIKDKPNAKKIKIKKAEIEFKKISFAYDKRKIIKNINLKIKNNEKIAFVGHSGSGKTTLVKLLYRLYDVNKGEITIDNQKITDITQESLREAMSIVPQEGILFNDSIKNNLLFSKPNATKKEIINAMKSAQLYKFVKELPQKEKTLVGERGIKLSGGEKQRLSIARAILANKKILVLDEATSALDSKTENEIQKALTKLMEGRTTLIIAHRLSTIMHSDKIVVFDNGKIAQIGKHENLIKEKGIYKDLWSLQKDGYLQE